MKSLFLSLFLLTTYTASSQIFGKLLDKTADKVAQKFEDQLTDKIANELATAAYRPVESAVDDMFRQQYEATYDVDAGEEPEQDYASFMNSFLTPVDIPEGYDFDVQVLAEVKDYDGEKNNMTLLMSKSNNNLGIITKDGNNEGMIIMDHDGDIMVIYGEDRGEKTVTAIPSMMKLAGKHVEDNMKDITMEKTGKTKKIVGYQCEEWKIEDETNLTKAYIAEDFPASWLKSFDGMFKSVSPNTRANFVDGMVLKSESKTKKKGKKTTYEVKKVIIEDFKINNSDYNQVKYGQD